MRFSSKKKKMNEGISAKTHTNTRNALTPLTPHPTPSIYPKAIIWMAVGVALRQS